MRLGLTLGSIAEITGGTLSRGDATIPIDVLSTDTRTLPEGALFVPLVGDRFDAHDFLDQAFSQGAVAALVTRRAMAQLPHLIQVEDTLDALAAIASHHRRQFSIPVIGITGSNGKTTTRAMLASILSQDAILLAPEKSFNNRVGVPLTMLELLPQHARAIFELGTNHPGEIRQLAELVQPQIGVITNVSPTHLEGLGSVDAVAEEKGSLLDIAADVVLNADDPMTERLRAHARGRSAFFGFNSDADVRASDVQQQLPTSPDESPALRFRLCIRAECADVRMPGLGKHHVSNALAASAAAWLAGCSLEQIQVGLAAYTPVAMRTQLCRLGEITCINDTYNANPASTRAALALLRDFPTDGRRIAVLGDMLELGQSSAYWHREIGKVAAQSGLDYLVTVGKQAHLFAEGAHVAGFPASRTASIRTLEEAAQFLPERLVPGDLVLLKASRGVQLEALLERLLG